jgi:hypothetical protein
MKKIKRKEKKRKERSKTRVLNGFLRRKLRVVGTMMIIDIILLLLFVRRKLVKEGLSGADSNGGNMCRTIREE